MPMGRLASHEPRRSRDFSQALTASSQPGKANDYGFGRSNPAMGVVHTGRRPVLRARHRPAGPTSFALPADVQQL